MPALPIKNADGATPLHYAARRGCADTSKLLLYGMACYLRTVEIIVG